MDASELETLTNQLVARCGVYADDRAAAIRAMHRDVVEILDGKRDPDEFYVDAEPEDEFGLFRFYDLLDTYRRVAVNKEQLAEEEIELLRNKVDKLRDDYIDYGYANVARFITALQAAATLGIQPTQVVSCQSCGRPGLRTLPCAGCGEDPEAIRLESEFSHFGDEQARLEHDAAERIAEEARAWHHAREIREYAKEALRRLDEIADPTLADFTRRTELGWALRQADRINPLN